VNSAANRVTARIKLFKTASMHKFKFYCELEVAQLKKIGSES